MNYTDLLARQEAQREKLHVDRYNEHKKLLELQKNSPVPERFEPEKQNLSDRYVTLEKAMNQRHEQERKHYIPDKEQTQAKEEAPPKQEKDPITDSQEKAAAMLEEYRQRQKERKERGYER